MKLAYKNGPMELDADEPRKFQGPPDRILGPADMGGGGVGEGKSEDSLWRNLSALGPFWGRGELKSMTSWWPGLPDVSETRLRPSPTSNPPAAQPRP